MCESELMMSMWRRSCLILRSILVTLRRVLYQIYDIGEFGKLEWQSSDVLESIGLSVHDGFLWVRWQDLNFLLPVNAGWCCSPAARLPGFCSCFAAGILGIITHNAYVHKSLKQICHSEMSQSPHQ